MIRLHDFSIGYDERTLLREVNAAIPKGSLTALIGRNGTGKSTLLRAIAGLKPRLCSGLIYWRKVYNIEMKRPPARSCTSVKPGNTFATATDSSALYRSCAGWRKDEEKVMEEKLGEKKQCREQVWIRSRRHIGTTGNMGLCHSWPFQCHMRP